VNRILPDENLGNKIYRIKSH